MDINKFKRMIKDVWVDFKPEEIDNYYSKDYAHWYFEEKKGLDHIRAYVTMMSKNPTLNRHKNYNIKDFMVCEDKIIARTVLEFMNGEKLWGNAIFRIDKEDKIAELWVAWNKKGVSFFPQVKE